MNKNFIGKRIRADRAKIIKMYKADMFVIDIANKYGVVESTIHRHLRNWGIPTKKGAYNKRKVRKHWKLKKSPELQARMAENSRINNRHIRHVEFKHATEDQRLIDNILCHPIIG